MHISSVLPWVEQYGATNPPGPSRLVCICCTSANLTVYHMQAGKSAEGATGTWYRKGPTTATDGLESSRTHVTSRTKPPSLGIFGIIVKQCQTLLTWHSIDSMLCFRRKVLTRRLDVTIQAHTHTPRVKWRPQLNELQRTPLKACSLWRPFCGRPKLIPTWNRFHRSESSEQIIKIHLKAVCMLDALLSRFSMA